MDLRHYYAKMRQIEAELHGDFVVLSSLETPDGGKAGVLSEARRAVAAKLILDGRARLATDEEAQGFTARNCQTRKLAEQAAAARRVQVAIVADSEVRGARRKE